MMWKEKSKLRRRMPSISFQICWYFKVNAESCNIFVGPSFKGLLLQLLCYSNPKSSTRKTLTDAFLSKIYIQPGYWKVLSNSLTNSSGNNIVYLSRSPSRQCNKTVRLICKLARYTIIRNLILIAHMKWYNYHRDQLCPRDLNQTMTPKLW